ncbi:MAG TPA: fumarylacetoacetate hydrolase family protein [Myxococcaceae bacterium]|nr:fumarylacetoacetate hydrolase family protein [Myxococcaceae bacterium]
MRLGLVVQQGAAKRRTLVAEVKQRLVALEDLPADPLAVLLNPELRSEVERRLRGGAPEVAESAVTFLPPVVNPRALLCVGLNYADHAKEGNFERPKQPVFFLRLESSVVGHGVPMIRPRVSEQFDYEGEVVAVIGKAGRAISASRALDYVVAYSLFNDGSVRDWQFKGPQWTMGKNFDASGAFGPFLVSADEVPPGADGLRISTRLNGKVVQDASTRDLIFPVAELIAYVSEAVMLRPGDVIVTGTPSGVGFARKPPLFMKDGDVCEIEVERIGVLRNPIRDEAAL